MNKILTAFAWLLLLAVKAESQELNKAAIPVKVFRDVNVAIYSGQRDAGPGLKPKKNSSDTTATRLKHIIDSMLGAEKPVPPVFDCNKAEQTKPLTLGRLNIIDNRVFDVTNSQNIDLGLFMVNGNIGRKDILIQANFFIYRDYQCTDGSTTRVLVGMTLYLHVTDLNIGASTKSLPNISAAVQLNKGKAAYQLKFYGLTNSIDFKDLPNIGDLNVESYSKIITAWDKIKNSLDKDSEIDPIVIPNYKDPQ